MKEVKVTMKSDVSINDTAFIYEKEVDLSTAGKIISIISEYEALLPTSKCRYRDCPEMKYSGCPVHGKK